MQRVSILLSVAVFALLSACDTSSKLASVAQPRDLDFTFPSLAPHPVEPPATVRPRLGEGVTTTMSDEDFLNNNPPVILEKRTGTTLTSTVASASGYTKFTGTVGHMETNMDWYFQGEHKERLPDTDDFHYDALDAVNVAMGWCGSNAAYPGCPHEMGTTVAPIYLPRDCDSRISASSTHRVENFFHGILWGQPVEQTSLGPTKSQPACQTEEPDPSAGGSSGGGDASDTGGGDEPSSTTYQPCEVWCSIWYWYDPDTGAIEDILSVDCWCA